MTKGKRTKFKDDEELKGLLEAAWTRLAERGPIGLEQGKTVRIRKCVFSVTSVSEEAGCARGLIGHKNCNYPAVRKWLKDKIAMETTGATCVLITLIEDVSHLSRKLQARYRAYDALCQRLGVSWNNSSNPDETAPESTEGTVKMRIELLRGRRAEFEKRIAIFDTQYANVILRQRLANLGLRPDMRPIKPASKIKRRSSISIVGKLVKAQQPE